MHLEPSGGFAMRTVTVMIVAMLAGSMQLAAQGWKQVYPAYEAENYTSIFNGGGDTLYISGMNFTLLRSVDRGAHWEKIFRTLGSLDIWRGGYDGSKVYLLPGGTRFQHAQGTDTTNAFLIAYNPATRDTSRIRFPIFGRSFSSSNYFHLDLSVCRDALFLLQSQYLTKHLVLLRSMDQGASWGVVPLPDSLKELPYCTINFRNARCGFLWAVESAAPSSFVLFSTKDAGVSWIRHEDFRIPRAGVPFELPLTWIDDSTAAAMNPAGSFCMSTDYGDTWEVKSTPPAWGMSIRMNIGGTGYLAGKNFDVFRTSDHGSSWIRIRDAFSLNSSLQGAMIGDSTFVLVTDNGYRIATNDGGVSWIDNQVNPYSALYRPQFLSRDVGYVRTTTNAGGALVSGYARSVDGGKSWTPFRAPTTRYCYLIPVSPTVVYAYQGGIPASDTLVMVTRDGGQQWSLCLRDTIAWFGASAPLPGRMARGDDTVFVLVGDTLVYTSDGGRTWTAHATLPSKFSSDESLWALDMSHRVYSWAISDNKILRSSDDGMRWDTLGYPGLAEGKFHLMKVFDGLRVAVVSSARKSGGSGTLFLTSDGGGIWTASATAGPALETGSEPCLFSGGFGMASAAPGTSVPGGRLWTFYATSNYWKSYEERFSMSVGASFGGFSFVDTATGWIAIGDRIYFTSTGGIDAADAPPASAPFALAQNYPNPFSSHTIIPYSIAGSGAQQLRIELYDAMGRHVATLYDGTASAGEHALPFDASGFVPGMYFVRLVTGGKTEVRKMVVVAGGR
jgi:photosystem II stability/assembly factor-like uncharacterized protein